MGEADSENEWGWGGEGGRHGDSKTALEGLECLNAAVIYRVRRVMETLTDAPQIFDICARFLLMGINRLGNIFVFIQSWNHLNIIRQE